MNKTLTSLFCILAFLFLYACSSSDPTPTPPSTPTHKVTFDVNKPDGVSATVTNPPSDLTVNDNTTATKPATPPTLDGYTFGGWYTEASTTTAFQFSTKITQDTTLYAKWTPRQAFTITYHANKPSDAPPEATVTGVPENPVSIPEGQTATAPTPPTLTGYNFAEWYTEEAATNPYDFSQVITANIDLYAKWNIQQFTITYHSNKPQDVTATVTGEPENPVSIPEGQTATPPTPPTLANYNFVGWYTDEAATNQFNFSRVITANIDLYAKWTALQTFTVSYNANKPTGVTDNVMGVPTDVKVIINLATTEPSTEPTLVGYTFEGWYTEQATTTKFVFTRTITVNIDLYAKWTIQEFTVTYDANKPIDATADVTGPPNPVMINYNLRTSEPSPKPTLVGYTFKGWYTEQATTTKFVFTTPITEDKTLYAKWVFRPSTKSELLAEINRAITPTTPSPNLNYIDTSLIDDMSGLFKNKSDFNGDISEWNVSLVENMRQMFYGASSFSQNISSWNVSLVNNMSDMFRTTPAFNGNISSWNVSLVENMSQMFYGASSFNQNISSWNVSLVNNMSYMFIIATAFNQNISSWNVSLVNNMEGMFANAKAFNQELNNWNVSLVNNMEGMFANAKAFNQELNNWNVSLVRNMSDMFNGAKVFNGNISNWRPTALTNMSNMFNNASAFTININSWNIASSVDKTDAFIGSGLASNLPSWAM